MWNDEKGSLVVEASLTFVTFVFVLITFISIINVMWVYSKIQHALTSTVSELSSFTYIYSVVGLQDANGKFNQAAADSQQKMDELLGSLKTLGSVGDGNITFDKLGELNDSVNNIHDTAQGVVDDPVGTLKGVLAAVLKNNKDAFVNYLLKTVAPPLMKKNLTCFTMDGKTVSISMTADELLMGNFIEGGMKGLDFSKSQLFMDENEKQIDLVVTYQIKLPMGLKANMMQRAVTSAWLDGDGGSYE